MIISVSKYDADDLRFASWVSPACLMISVSRDMMLMIFVSPVGYPQPCLMPMI